MEIINKILNIEERKYSCNLNEKTLKQRIENLSEQKELRLVGSFTSDNEFTIYDRWSVIAWDVPNVKRKAAYLFGEIINKGETTMLNVKSKPNSFLPFFAFFATLIGVIIGFRALPNYEEDMFYLLIGLVLIVMGLVYYPLSSLLKNRIRNKIVKYLDLNRV